MFPVSPLDIFACLASWPHYAAAGGGGEESFSWLSTFPCLPRCAAHPAEAPPVASMSAALPRPPRGVQPGADALVLPTEEPASCPGATHFCWEGGRHTSHPVWTPDSLFPLSAVADKIWCGYAFEKVVKLLLQCDLGIVESRQTQLMFLTIPTSSPVPWEKQKCLLTTGAVAK